MDDYSIVNFVVNAIIFFAILYFIHRRDRNSLIDLGDEVTIRGTIISRVLNWYIKTVKKRDVVKIQLAGNYVTLFNKSDNAYDIFPRRESAKYIFEQAQALFPHAEVIKIDG